MKEESPANELIERSDLHGIFRTLKTKTSGQKFKDKCKKSWD